jgi:hypothetical protein
MIVAIDTSSFVMLARYYLPFDRGVLFNFFKSKIETGEFIVLDKVYQECLYTAKGIVTDTLDYLKEKSNQIKTVDLLPSQKFFNQVENQFINGSAKNLLTAVEFEERKDNFLESADAKLILFCLKQKGTIEEVLLITEESEISNDNKAFKKLPAICKMLEIQVKTLPDLLKLYNINIEFK